ncbi:MAG: gamma-glutamylcyclotransferase [Saprospiraceae bacterium]|nr:gamma-glutamylcyclotransferase [Saprospiraceae bacterium]
MNLHPEINLVFSYGTLKRGFPNHSIMEEIKASYISDASTNFKYPLLLDGKWNTPFMIHKKNFPNSYKISGELFEIDNKGIIALDKFEGVDKCYYKRLEIEISYKHTNGDTTSKDAWCYFRYENASKLLVDPSRFISFYGKEEVKKYTAVHFRPFDWRNK